MVPSGPLTILFAAMITVYLFALALFHLMILKVNRRLTCDDSIPHSLYWRRGGWNELKERYQSFYPRGRLFSLTVYLTILFFGPALVLSAVLWWRFIHGK